MVNRCDFLARFGLLVAGATGPLAGVSSAFASTCSSEILLIRHAEEPARGIGQVRTPTATPV